MRKGHGIKLIERIKGELSLFIINTYVLNFLQVFIYFETKTIKFYIFV